LALASFLFFSIAGSAHGVTFNQSGPTVQVNTVNDIAHWHVDVYFSNTTESPIPTANFYNDYAVSTGTVSYSVTMPNEHRRYRFIVDSVRPETTIETTGCSVTAGGFGRSGSNDAVWRVVRGAGTVAQWGSGGTTTEITIQAGDVLRAINTASPQLYEDYAFTEAGTLPAGQSLAVFQETAGQDWDEELEQWVTWSAYEWSAFTLDVLAGDPEVDDSGEGTFENPDWYGFDAPTAAFSVDTTNGVTPLAVMFDGLASSHPLGISSYSWDFGDATYSSEPTAAHTYNAAGTYEVTLEVTAAGVGGPSSYSDMIHVSEPETVPPSETPSSSEIHTVAVSSIGPLTSAGVGSLLTALTLTTGAGLGFILLGGHHA
jgi:PKD repeat protein